MATCAGGMLGPQGAGVALISGRAEMLAANSSRFSPNSAALPSATRESTPKDDAQQPKKKDRNVRKLSSGPYLVSRTGAGGMNQTLT